MRIALFISVVAVCSSLLHARSPEGDSAAGRSQGGTRYLALPAIAYMPETRFIGGMVGACIWQSDDTLKKSSIGGQLLYSQNDQLQAGVSFEIFSDSGRSRLSGEAGYSYWPGKLFGIGNRTPAAAEEPFTEKFFRSRISLFISVAPGISAGPEYELRTSSDVETSAGGSLRTTGIGGVERFIASGLGVAALLDTRDDNFAPVRGRFVYLSGRWYGGLLGSDYSFARYMVDARGYIPLYDEHVLGLQAYICAISGLAPFQMLSLLGGDVRGRGYYNGRYRDNMLFSAQAEYRTPLLFRCGLVLFGGITQVSENVAGLALREIHPFAGFGIRFRLLNDARVNLRFDWGYGDNSSGNYIGVNEAF
jgi:hypothetical protein